MKGGTLAPVVFVFSYFRVFVFPSEKYLDSQEARPRFTVYGKLRLDDSARDGFQVVSDGGISLF